MKDDDPLIHSQSDEKTSEWGHFGSLLLPYLAAKAQCGFFVPFFPVFGLVFTLVGQLSFFFPLPSPKS